MNRVYQAASGFFLLLALFIGAKSLIDLQFYNRLGPGAGFFPFWLSVGLGILAVAMFYQATVGPRQVLAADFIPEKEGLIRILAIIFAIGTVPFTMQFLGFRLTMFVFVSFLIFVFGGRNIFLIVLVAAIGSFGIFKLFVDLLKVQLPIGTFGI